MHSDEWSIKTYNHEAESKLNFYSRQPSILDDRAKFFWAMSVTLLLNQQTLVQHDASEQLTLRQDDVIDSKSWTGTFCGWSRLWVNAYTLRPGRCLALQQLMIHLGRIWYLWYCLVPRIWFWTVTVSVWSKGHLQNSWYQVSHFFCWKNHGIFCKKQGEQCFRFRVFTLFRYQI